MVRAIGDEEPLALFIGQDFAGEEKGRVPFFAEADEVEADRRLVEGLFLLAVFDELGDDLIERLVIAFAGGRADDVAGRIDDDQRRPRTHAVLVPDLVVAVVHHGVGDFVPQHGLADVLGFLLAVELGAVHADDDDLVGVLLFELGQVGQRVDAVDAAERPEVEQDDLPLQILHRDRPGRVEPVHLLRELGGWLIFVRFGFGGLLHRHLRGGFRARPNRKQGQHCGYDHQSEHFGPEKRPLPRGSEGSIQRGRHRRILRGGRGRLEI